MRTDFRWLRETASLPEVVASMDRGHVDELPVIGSDGLMKGVVHRDDLVDREDGATAGDLARHVPWATYEEPIPEVLQQMKAAHVTALPVVTAHGAVEGVVVLDDIARDPTYADMTADVMHPRGRLARLGLALEDTFPAASVTAGLGLLAMAMLGTAYGGNGTAWMPWVDAAAGLVALIAAGMYRTPDLLGVALTAFLGVVLVVVGLFGRLIGAPHWLGWLHLLGAVGFIALTASAATSHTPRPHPLWARRRRAFQESIALR
jgi:CBS domain-containing protein